MSKFALNLSGIQDDKEIFNRIHNSFNEESHEKLNGMGLIKDEYNLFELESVLFGFGNELTLEEEFALPQRAEESVHQYLKRLRGLLPHMGEDVPSVEEFLEIFAKGIHANLKEATRNLIIDQMNRLSRKFLKETMYQLEAALKVIANSSKDRILKPKNTCYCCKSKHFKCPFDLEDVEKACDDIY